MNTIKQNDVTKARKLSDAELASVAGGIWRYSSRLGAAGQQLEERQDAKYGVNFNPGTLDEAAHQALEGWVTIP